MDLEGIYNNLTYFDLYGGSVILITLLSIVLLLFIIFTNILQHITVIKDNWQDERCKIQNIPFAGYINKPEDSTISDFTQTNFNYCTRNIVTDISKLAVSPLTFITDSLTGIFTSILNSIQIIREMINSIRINLLNIISTILDKMVNITIPLRQLTLSISDGLGRTTGILVTLYYSIIGTYDILGAIFGAFQQLLEIILIPVLITIIIFYSTFLFPLAIAPSIVALIITVLIGINMYISSVVDNNLCFDKNTQLSMANGSNKYIKDIQVGDKLINNNIITEKFILCAKNLNMYKLYDGTIVSESHYIKYNNNWIKIKDYPNCEKIYNYNEPFIYCINTSTKRLIIGNNEYLDWDDLVDITINKKQQCYDENTIISLFNGTFINITNIKIGDILSHGEKVSGLVESLDKTNKLYHLITDKKSFYINNNKVDHYD